MAFAVLRLEGQVDVNHQQNDNIQATQAAIAKERNFRVRLQSEINRFVCHENNVQDRTLKQLLRAISAARAMVQLPDVSRAYKRAIRNLTPPSNCQLLAKSYRHAASEEDFDAIIEALLRRDYRVR